VVPVYARAQVQFDHPLGHPFDLPLLAHGLPQPREHLPKLYTVYAVDVSVASADLTHVALHSPQQGLLLIA
jgi:hypothetical protein